MLNDCTAKRCLELVNSDGFFLSKDYSLVSVKRITDSSQNNGKGKPLHNPASWLTISTFCLQICYTFEEFSGEFYRKNLKGRVFPTFTPTGFYHQYLRENPSGRVGKSLIGKIGKVLYINIRSNETTAGISVSNGNKRPRGFKGGDKVL
jgi:hypothetical protein